MLSAGFLERFTLNLLHFTCLHNLSIYDENHIKYSLCYVLFVNSLLSLFCSASILVYSVVVLSFSLFPLFHLASK